MPWKKLDDGKLELSGLIARWVQQFQAWYLDDFKNSGKLNFQTYLVVLTTLYANYAKGKWQKDGLIDKVKVLDSHVALDPQGYRVKIFETLEYLAENLSEQTMIEWGPICREEAKKHLEIE
jgi:bifunctional ADP-heptose synthase (sugar kinase/adenylyltransferase)